MDRVMDVSMTYNWNVMVEVRFLINNVIKIVLMAID